GARGHAADDPVLDHRFLERHRDLLLGAEADRGIELVGVLDRRQPHGPHDEALVGDPEAHRVAQAVGVEEGAEGGGDRFGLGDLTVAEGPRGQRPDAGGDHARDAGLEPGLDRGNAAGLDLQAGDGTAGALLAAELRQRQLGAAEARAAGAWAAGPRARQADLFGQDRAHNVGGPRCPRGSYPSAAEARNNSLLPRNKWLTSDLAKAPYREMDDTRPASGSEPFEPGMSGAIRPPRGRSPSPT